MLLKLYRTYLLFNFVWGVSGSCSISFKITRQCTKFRVSDFRPLLFLLHKTLPTEPLNGSIEGFRFFSLSQFHGYIRIRHFGNVFRDIPYGIPCWITHRSKQTFGFADPDLTFRWLGTVLVQKDLNHDFMAALFVS